jgi:hypothetical protein
MYLALEIDRLTKLAEEQERDMERKRDAADEAEALWYATRNRLGDLMTERDAFA